MFSKKEMFLFLIFNNIFPNKLFGNFFCLIFMSNLPTYLHTSNTPYSFINVISTKKILCHNTHALQLPVAAHLDTLHTNVHSRAEPNLTFLRASRVRRRTAVRFIFSIRYPNRERTLLNHRRSYCTCCYQSSLQIITKLSILVFFSSNC